MLTNSALQVLTCKLLDYDMFDRWGCRCGWQHRLLCLPATSDQPCSVLGSLLGRWQQGDPTGHAGPARSQALAAARFLL